MDEIVTKKSTKSKILEQVIKIFIIEPVSFSSKKRINIRGILWLTCIFLGLFCLAVFFIPTKAEQTKIYSERGKDQGQDAQGNNRPPNRESESHLPASAIGSYLSSRGGTNEKAATNRNTSMVIPRDNDSSTTLPPGTKFWVKLAQSVVVTKSSMPVIGIVASSVQSSSSVAISENSEIYGDAVLDVDAERVAINWKSIQFPDGRSKALTAIALGSDNQTGVEGNFHSDALKNTAGQMISRFVGGFADGAINRGMLGASEGGIRNGLLQGVADTAKDRTQAWGEDLKKTREWIELHAGEKFQVILSQPFIFRDPGGVF